MIKTQKSLLGLWALLLSLTCAAQSSDVNVGAIEADLTFVQGDIDILDGMSTLHVGPRFEYLDSIDAQRVLQAKGIETSRTVVGMIIPADSSPFDPNSWNAVLNYEQTGYIDSAEANTLSAQELLLEARKVLAVENQANRVSGLTTKEHLGFSHEPRFSHAEQTLYWSQRNRTDGNEASTNFYVTTLGRQGHLTLSATIPTDLEVAIDARIPSFVKLVEFNEGHRYEDYVYDSDKVADYSITALITGNYEPENKFIASLTGITGNASNKLLLGVLTLLLIFVLFKQHSNVRAERPTQLRAKKVRS